MSLLERLNHAFSGGIMFVQPTAENVKRFQCIYYTNKTTTTAAAATTTTTTTTTTTNNNNNNNTNNNHIFVASNTKNKTIQRSCKIEK